MAHETDVHSEWGSHRSDPAGRGTWEWWPGLVRSVKTKISFSGKCHFSLLVTNLFGLGRFGGKSQLEFDGDS